MSNTSRGSSEIDFPDATFCCINSSKREANNNQFVISTSAGDAGLNIKDLGIVVDPQVYILAIDSNDLDKYIVGKPNELVSFKAPESIVQQRLGRIGRAGLSGPDVQYYIHPSKVEGDEKPATTYHISDFEWSTTGSYPDFFEEDNKLAWLSANYPDYPPSIISLLREYVTKVGSTYTFNKDSALNAIKKDKKLFDQMSFYFSELRTGFIRYKMSSVKGLYWDPSADLWSRCPDTGISIAWLPNNKIGNWFKERGCRIRYDILAQKCSFDLGSFGALFFYFLVLCLMDLWFLMLYYSYIKLLTPSFIVVSMYFFHKTSLIVDIAAVFYHYLGLCLINPTLSFFEGLRSIFIKKKKKKNYDTPLLVDGDASPGFTVVSDTDETVKTITNVTVDGRIVDIGCILLNAFIYLLIFSSYLKPVNFTVALMFVSCCSYAITHYGTKISYCLGKQIKIRPDVIVDFVAREIEIGLVVYWNSIILSTFALHTQKLDFSREARTSLIKSSKPDKFDHIDNFKVSISRVLIAFGLLLPFSIVYLFSDFFSVMSNFWPVICVSSIITGLLFSLIIDVHLPVGQTEKLVCMVDNYRSFLPVMSAEKGLIAGILSIAFLYKVSRPKKKLPLVRLVILLAVLCQVNLLSPKEDSMGIKCLLIYAVLKRLE